MNGATIPRPSQARTSEEATTSAASQPQAGIRRALLTTKLDLGEPPGELPRLRHIRGDPDVRRGLAQLPEHRVFHSIPARCLLERGGVEVRDAPEVIYLVLGHGAILRGKCLVHGVIGSLIPLKT